MGKQKTFPTVYGSKDEKASLGSNSEDGILGAGVETLYGEE